MFQLRFLFLVFAAFSFLLGCSKKAPDQGGSSHLSFGLPKNFGIGNGALSGAACFAVNVKAQDIPTTVAGPCDDDYGVFAGLVPLGSTIEMSAPRGAARTIEIFYVISEVGCELNFEPAKGLGQTFGSNKVFRIGSIQADFDQPVVSVDLPIQFPSTVNSLKNIYSTPATCDKLSTITISAIKQASSVVGEVRGTTNLGSRAHVRVVDKQIELTAPSTWSGRIIPARLGEK